MMPFQLTNFQGTLTWDGVFAPENLTYEAQGNDPTSGDANRISPSAFIEGYPNNTYITQSATDFMIEQVFKYPGQVSIYAAGSLTNIALAIRQNSSFAATAKELVIMGGYVDLNLLQVMSDFDQDLGSDINFIVRLQDYERKCIEADFGSGGPRGCSYRCYGELA